MARTLHSLVVTQLLALVAEGLDGEASPPGEVPGGLRTPPQVLAEPPGVGEVVERDQRRQASVVAGPQDVAVAGDGRLVGVALLGLHPGPFDREPERVATQPGDQVEVLLVALPETDGRAGGLDPAGGLPAVPVVPGLSRTVVAALDLEAGGGHAEAEALGQHAPVPGLVPRRHPWPREHGTGAAATARSPA